MWKGNGCRSEAAWLFFLGVHWVWWVRLASVPDLDRGEMTVPRG